jgi:hypothetical protein
MVRAFTTKRLGQHHWVGLAPTRRKFFSRDDVNSNQSLFTSTEAHGMRLRLIEGNSDFMKTILCSLLAAIAMTSCSMAQSITVTLTPTTTPSCTFQASGVVQGITMPDPIPGTFQFSPGVLQPITITKGPEQCSNQLIVDIFRPSGANAVTCRGTRFAARCSSRGFGRITPQCLRRFPGAALAYRRALRPGNRD